MISEMSRFSNNLYESKGADRDEIINKILPLFHTLIVLFTYMKFPDVDKMKRFAQNCHELRLLPLPYGLLPHELIEVLDNENIVPGITKMFKLAEDFPFIDTLKEESKQHNFHQRAYVYAPEKEENPLFKLF